MTLDLGGIGGSIAFTLRMLEQCRSMVTANSMAEQNRLLMHYWPRPIRKHLPHDKQDAIAIDHALNDIRKSANEIGPAVNFIQELLQRCKNILMANSKAEQQRLLTRYWSRRRTVEQDELDAATIDQAIHDLRMAQKAPVHILSPQQPDPVSEANITEANVTAASLTLPQDWNNGGTGVGVTFHNPQSSNRMVENPPAPLLFAQQPVVLGDILTALRDPSGSGGNSAQMTFTLPPDLFTPVSSAANSVSPNRLPAPVLFAQQPVALGDILTALRGPSGSGGNSAQMTFTLPPDLFTPVTTAANSVTPHRIAKDIPVYTTPHAPPPSDLSIGTSHTLSGSSSSGSNSGAAPMDWKGGIKIVMKAATVQHRVSNTGPTAMEEVISVENYYVGPRNCCVASASTSQSEVLDLTSELDQELQSAEIRQNKNNFYDELIELENQALIPNMENLECEICIDTCSPGQGVMLRECLHGFCKNCLGEMIKQSTEPQVRCPAIGCESVLQDREIKNLVSAEDYEKWLQRGLNLAESGASQSFHCRYRDCPGWIFREEEVQRFPCPVCHRVNCVPCEAIHEAETCEQYQDSLKNAEEVLASNREADKKTKAFIERLRSTGKLMECPGCKVLITKKSGCDGMTCTACKIAICWATKGPRWGPGGRGDFSGGCRCWVNGKRCHPNCRNCH